MTSTLPREQNQKHGLDLKAVASVGQADVTPYPSPIFVAGPPNPIAAFALLPLFQVFVFLQFLDALTTLGVLQQGGYEANPIVNKLMALGSFNGLVLAKLLVVAIGTAVLWHGRHRVLFMANVIYTGIICWNLIALGFAG